MDAKGARASFQRLIHFRLKDYLWYPEAKGHLLELISAKEGILSCK